MKFEKKKTKTLITFFLIFAFASSIFALPAANAHDPAWKIPTYAYVTVSPSPIGVGQTAIVVMWIDWPPPSANGFFSGYRWQNYKLEVTKPDNSTETLGPFLSDPVGSAYRPFTPDQAGKYSFVFKFPEQILQRNHPVTGAQGSNSEYVNDTFLASTSNVAILTVQDEQITVPAGNPLPTEYWTRPIEGQNIQWSTIASNWLWKDRNFFQPDGSAPNSPHVMWTKPINDGGIVGGAIGQDIKIGMNFYSGLAYNARFANPLVMYGRLYYELPNRNSAAGGGYLCVDLRTGEELWYLNATSVPSFGAYYDYEDPNQHGVIPNGVLYTNNFARAIDPQTGRYWYNMTNVPSGQETRANSGEILRYVINYTGRWLAQWNVSSVETTTTTGSLDAGTTNRYDWNVTIPTSIPANSHTLWAQVDDLLLGTNLVEVGIGGFFTRPDPYTVWAVSLKPENRGQLVWTKNFAAPAGNVSQVFQRVDPVNRSVIFQYKESMLFSAISLDSGDPLWAQTTRIVGANDFDYYDNTVVSQRCSVAYGRMYYTGQGGILYCYDTKTGDLLWTYGNGGPGNSTAMGLNGVYPNYPSYIFSIADGKVYTLTGEHSPNVPLYTNGQTRCIDAYTGKEIWTLTGWGGYPSRTGAAMADGFFTYFNCYDSQIYCIGKGPSQLTVTAPDNGVELGKSVIIRGMVTDIAAGTKQKEQAARFPNGVPAVSDESMATWMEYAYMQKTKPTNTIGVPVSIYVLDSNDNYRPIGNVTSDSSGMFSLSWKPDIEGDYSVYATFEGSDSYWPSQAATSFVVDQAPPQPTQQPVVAQPPTEMYFALSTAAIIIAVAIATLLIIKKR